VVKHTTNSSFGFLTESNANTIGFSGSTSSSEHTSSLSIVKQSLSLSGLRIRVIVEMSINLVVLSFLNSSLISGQSINSGLSSLAKRRMNESQLLTDSLN